MAKKHDESKTRPQQSFGSKLAELLGQMKLSQSELARRTGIDRTDLSRMINGHRNPRPDQVVWIAAALGVTQDTLMDYVELPEEFAKAAEQLADAVRRVLVAESERDEMKASLIAIENAHERERTRLESERMDEVAEHRRLLEELRMKANKLSQDFQDTKKRHAAALEKLTKERDSMAAARDYQANLAKDLNTKLAKERSDRAGTTMLTGIAGLFVGALMNDKPRRG